MKNRVLTIFAVCLIFAGPSLSRAQSPSAGAASGKIGLLNIQAAILNTAEGKKSMADLDKKYQPKKAELQKMQQDIQGLEDQIQRQQTAASDTAQAQLTRQLDEKKKIFTRTQQDAQDDFTSDRSDVVSRISQKMGRVVQDFAEQNGYAAILDTVAPVFSNNGQIGDAQVPVYYAGKDVDITEEIVRRYDAANPVAGAASEPPAAAKPAATKPAAKTPEKPKP
ncbi:MAG TPA: OmpH family outer membrane protein [Terriglobia bacterium]|nr:OmpH family outer membrane protein [Terriglobia bacterium]